MSPPPPIAVRLPRAFALGRLSMAQVLRRPPTPGAAGRAGATRGDVRRAAGNRWRLSSREWTFARRLLTGRRTNLWLYRTDQKRRAGDFAVVDVSSPVPDRRRVWVMDLKCGAPLILGGGGAGIQLQNAPDVIACLAAAGVIAADTPPTLAVGDRERLLTLLGA